MNAIKEGDAAARRDARSAAASISQASQSRDYKWHDRYRNRRASDQHQAEMFVFDLPDGSAPSDRDKHARNAEYPDQQGRADHQC